MKTLKLLNREPTEEMIEAARSYHEGDSYLPHSLFKAMYDAAPELTVSLTAVDMEPFGYLKRVHTSKSYIGNLSSDSPQEGFEAVYSFTQVGIMRHKDNQAIITLQAENERLRKENEELKELLAGEPQH